MKTQGEESYLRAMERGLRRNRPCLHLELELPASRTMRRGISVVGATLLCGAFLWQTSSCPQGELSPLP